MPCKLALTCRKAFKGEVPLCNKQFSNYRDLPDIKRNEKDNEGKIFVMYTVILTFAKNTSGAILPYSIQQFSLQCAAL